MTSFITQYIPGFEWLVLLIAAHIFFSTIAHIKQKDFQISEWPKFLGMWLMFLVGIVLVNGILSVSQTLASASVLLPIVSVLQGAMYVIYFSYYLDNIIKHMNMLGLPVNPGLLELIKGMAGKITDTFKGGNSI